MTLAREQIPCQKFRSYLCTLLKSMIRTGLTRKKAVRGSILLVPTLRATTADNEFSGTCGVLTVGLLQCNASINFFVHGGGDLISCDRTFLSRFQLMITFQHLLLLSHD